METSPLPEATADELSKQVRLLKEQHVTHLRMQLALVLAVGVFVWRAAVMQHRSLREVRLVSARIQQDVARQQDMVAGLLRIAVNRPQFAGLLKQHGIDPATPVPAPNPPAVGR